MDNGNDNDNDNPNPNPRRRKRDAVGRLLGSIGNAIASRTAQKAVIGTTLGVIAAILLYIPAVVGYFYFYYNYLPDQVNTVPVHLQYGFGPNPFGIAALTPPAHLHQRQHYDITVALTLPRSPANLDRGNFMIALHLLHPATTLPPQDQLPYITPTRDPVSDPVSDPNNLAPSPDPAIQPTRFDLASYLATQAILHTSTRPALIPYTDPLASRAKRLLLLAYHILLPRAAGAVRLAVPMAEQLAFEQPPQPGSLLLEVQAGQDIQVYEASVTFTARLRGLRWFMYRWWGTAFVLFTGVFWAVEVVFMVEGALVGAWLSGLDWKGMLRVGGKGKGKGKGKTIKAEGDGEDETGSSSSENGEEIIKKEEDESEGSLQSPMAGASHRAESDEDDDDDDGEYDDDDLDSDTGRATRRAPEDSGVGTSYSGQASKHGARKRNVSGRRPSQ
ncbi:hypothetical protein BT67DRAFT_171410 [Trichocladium antarcticum]|uniref:Seipin n=1 Tax=Trichocladium antarcticum TaxID=1450529 RepID=A0AAN6ZAT2_9PEZI|nr:hypothetical protein BT67DRAFT_171410 [Trichocladium antarcticum]